MEPVTYAERRSSRLPATRWRRSAGPGTFGILPDGCMDLIWDGQRLLIAGPDTATVTFTADRRLELTALRFDSGVAPLVLGVPADEMTDARVDLADAWSPHLAREWAETLAAATDPLPALEQLAAARLAAAGGVPGWISATTRLLDSGASVMDVADALGVTARHLGRKALQHFGYGPKSLQRIRRLDRALGLLGTGGRLSDVAHRCGYADYPHMFRDFRRLTGAPPATFQPSAA